MTSGFMPGDDDKPLLQQPKLALIHIHMMMSLGKT